jgi:hypothetical protein
MCATGTGAAWAAEATAEAAIRFSCKLFFGEDFVYLYDELFGKNVFAIMVPAAGSSSRLILFWAISPLRPQPSVPNSDSLNFAVCPICWLLLSSSVFAHPKAELSVHDSA